VSLLALVAFVSFQMFADVWETPYLLAGYAAILVGLWVIYALAVRRFDLHGRYLDYRALAEALRVQFYWRLAGIPLNVSDFYLRRQAGQLSWIRHAARVCNIGSQRRASDSDIEVVRRHWIDGQADFFERSAKREERQFKRWNWLITVLYATGIVVAAEVALAMILGATVDKQRLDFVIVVMGLLPALAASIGFVLERRALEAHVQQYAGMKDLFQKAKNALSRAADAAEKRKILEEIGKEALAENGDWYFTHRLREVAPPRSG
jgi:hypothetical protein